MSELKPLDMPDEEIKEVIEAAWEERKKRSGWLGIRAHREIRVIEGCMLFGWEVLRLRKEARLTQCQENPVRGTRS